MVAIRRTQDKSFLPLGLAVLLALIAAAVYMLINRGILGVGDLQLDEQPPTIILAAAGCYLLGGLLVLTNRRWLWILGAIVNALVIVFFFRMYQNRPAVIVSPGGLLSETTQVLLELTLLYLIFKDWSRSRRAVR